jgi:DNA-binding response OmpR family regulator
MSILIVDDDVMMGRAVLRALECLGYVGRAVSTIDDALRSLAADRPGILLTDFQLGDGGDGVDLATWARNAYGVPAVLMTAHEPGPVRAELDAAGLADVEILAKPFSFDELSAKLLVHETDDHPWIPLAVANARQA